MVTHNTRIGPMGNNNFIGNIKEIQLSNAKSKPKGKMFTNLMLMTTYTTL